MLVCSSSVESQWKVTENSGWNSSEVPDPSKLMTLTSADRWGSWTRLFLIFIWRKERSGFTHRPIAHVLQSPAQRLFIFKTGIKPERYFFFLFFNDMKIFPSFKVSQTCNKEHENPPNWCCYEAAGKSEAFRTLSIIGFLHNLSIILQSSSSPNPRWSKYFALTSTVLL